MKSSNVEAKCRTKEEFRKNCIGVKNDDSRHYHIVEFSEKNLYLGNDFSILNIIIISRRKLGNKQLYSKSE